MELVYAGETDKYFTKGKTYTLEVSKFMDFSTIDDRTEKDEPQPHFMDVKFAFENFIHPSHYKPESEQKPESIYQVGDTVYHWRFGEGYVIAESLRDVLVSFGGIDSCFSRTGIYEKESKPSLSFTPYDLLNGGFSQERPKPAPKVGDWGWFYDDGDTFATFAELKRIEDPSVYGKIYVIGGNMYRKQYFSHEIPAHIKEKMK